MPLQGASHYRSRSITVAVVIGGHIALLALLIARHGPGQVLPATDRMMLVFIDPLETVARPAPTDRPTRASRPVRMPFVMPPPATNPTTDESTALSPGVDWYAHGTDAARRAATPPASRDFGFPKRDPAPREKKEFGWDKTHTERVHALEGGGIGIHLSDNCELVIAPFPMAGCAIGKRKARGDLFDEMKAPVEPGDWKDR